MVQDFLTAWINWYYGNDPYPQSLQNRVRIIELEFSQVVELADTNP